MVSLRTLTPGVFARKDSVDAFVRRLVCLDIPARNMALVRALTGLRQQVLSHVRVPVNASCLALPAAGTYLVTLRGFADSTYLDKSDVTDRIINVIKNFDNIKNPEKV